MRPAAFLIPLFAACTLPASAADWLIQPGSTLGFEGSAQGEAFVGRFERFKADIRFTPENLADTRFVVDVELASANTDNSERDELLQGSDFFASEQHASARFEATSATASTDGSFDLVGTLALKQHQQPVTLHFSWSEHDGKATLEGSTTLDRMAFGIGLGDWEDADMIGHAVKVTTRLQLRGKP